MVLAVFLLGTAPAADQHLAAREEVGVNRRDPPTVARARPLVRAWIEKSRVPQLHRRRPSAIDGGRGSVRPRTPANPPLDCAADDPDPPQQTRDPFQTAPPRPH